ncbi:elongation factor Tu [Striga asiatica]|uniref:Elongation factor Tu n=1 Tax=Striga asiatica TaxID=4170 RepID=A0A5A7RD03_STRAF|nr:elongation factor Tu [Striga asiatica]
MACPATSFSHDGHPSPPVEKPLLSRKSGTSAAEDGTGTSSIFFPFPLSGTSFSTGPAADSESRRSSFFCFRRVFILPVALPRTHPITKKFALKNSTRAAAQIREHFAPPLVPCGRLFVVVSVGLSSSGVLSIGEVMCGNGLKIDLGRSTMEQITNLVEGILATVKVGLERASQLHWGSLLLFIDAEDIGELLIKKVALGGKKKAIYEGITYLMLHFNPCNFCCNKELCLESLNLAFKSLEGNVNY